MNYCINQKKPLFKKKKLYKKHELYAKDYFKKNPHHKQTFFGSTLALKRKFFYLRENFFEASWILKSVIFEKS